MATKLNKLLKREIDVDGKPYMVTLSPEGVKLTEKGKRLVGRTARLGGLRGPPGGSGRGRREPAGTARPSA